jgi:hypothetical protein
LPTILDQLSHQIETVIDVGARIQKAVFGFESWFNPLAEEECAPQT